MPQRQITEGLNTAAFQYIGPCALHDRGIKPLFDYYCQRYMPDTAQIDKGFVTCSIQ